VCDCYGVTCETTGVVSALRLENIVRGHIPDDLALLTGLTLLELVLSDELVGTIPSSLENLTILRRLALNNNRLSGTIPPSLFGSSLTALTDLYVSLLPYLHFPVVRVSHLQFIEESYGLHRVRQLQNLSCHIPT
jgi:Leucine-rich repeat (LRR) protein